MGDRVRDRRSWETARTIDARASALKPCRVPDHYSSRQTPAEEIRPWPSLWAMLIGFFMILIDTTIVSVANPSIQRGLGTSTTGVLWVTSSYLLAYAVPLLVTGRLGDRFGPRRVFLIGLTVFTLASLWCGLSNLLPGSGITNLIVARAVQGLGAAVMSPQPMAVLTRTFPRESRGGAMALWGATAGVGTLIGPILGGVLVDWLGWEWIFFVNVPIGLVGFLLVTRLVPHLELHSHHFDWLGVVISGVAMFLIVFSLQEGNSYHWNAWVWSGIGAGVVVMGLFLWWQAVNRNEPLLPLNLFRDRNFSLANIAIATVGFAVTALFVPLIYYFQLVHDMTPTQSALMTAPSSVLGLVLAAPAGRLTDRVHPALLAGPGILLMSGGMGLYSAMMSATIEWWWLLIPLGRHGGRQRLRVGADLHHRQPQSAPAPGWCGCRRLQRHPAARIGDRLGRDRGPDGQPDRQRAVRGDRRRAGRERHGGRGRRAARLPEGAVHHRDGADPPAPRGRGADRCDLRLRLRQAGIHGIRGGRRVRLADLQNGVPLGAPRT